MNLDDVNNWCIEQLNIYIAETYWAPEDRKSNFQGNFTIEKAECREVVREKFKIETIRKFGKWSTNAVKHTWSAGKTISEAEIAVIKKLFEASHDR